MGTIVIVGPFFDGKLSNNGPTDLTEGGAA